MAATVRIRWVDADGTFQRGGIDAIDRACGAAWCWIDICDPDEAAFEAIAAPVGLHPLAVEDALDEQRRPKLDLYPEGPFLVWITPHMTANEKDITLTEIDVFLGAKALVTVHEGVSEEIDEVFGDGERTFRRGGDWVLHAILDRSVDSLLPVTDSIGDAIEDVEDRMLRPNPDRRDMERLHSLRRQLLVLHRIVAPERDIIRALARERDFVSEEAYRYFDDVVDHLLRVEDALETYRDVASAVMDIYLSAQSNRLNEIMKVLTVVTVVLGAVTAISGIYGMNVVRGMWPPVSEVWSFPAVVAAMLGVAVAMSMYFRRKNWW